MDKNGVSVVTAERARRKWNTILRAGLWCFGIGVLLATIALGIGCGTRHWPGGVFVTGYDFRTYTEAGFLFTPEGYDGPYESVALLTVTMYPEVTFDSRSDHPAVSSLFGPRSDHPAVSSLVERVLGPDERRVDNYVVEGLDVDAGIGKMYEQAVAMGADALMRFSVRTIESPSTPTNVRGVEITGFALRRQER